MSEFANFIKSHPRARCRRRTRNILYHFRSRRTVESFLEIAYSLQPNRIVLRGFDVSPRTTNRDTSVGNSCSEPRRSVCETAGPPLLKVTKKNEEKKNTKQTSEHRPSFGSETDNIDRNLRHRGIRAARKMLARPTR